MLLAFLDLKKLPQGLQARFLMNSTASVAKVNKTNKTKKLNKVNSNLGQGASIFSTKKNTGVRPKSNLPLGRQRIYGERLLDYRKFVVVTKVKPRPGEEPEAKPKTVRKVLWVAKNDARLKVDRRYRYNLKFSQRHVLRAKLNGRRLKFRLKGKFKTTPPESNYKVRPAVSDPIYQSKRINALLKVAMKNGERRVIERLVYRYLFELHANKKLRLLFFLKFFARLLIPMSLNSVRVGGRIYDVPFYTWWHRRLFFGYNLFLSSSNATKTQAFNKRLLKTTQEFVSERHGGFMGRRLRTFYRKLVKSRGYLHYRWY